MCVLNHLKYIYIINLCSYDNWIGPSVPLQLKLKKMINRDKSQRYIPSSPLYSLLKTSCNPFEVSLCETLNVVKRSEEAPLKLNEKMEKENVTAINTENDSELGCRVTCHEGLMNPFGALHGGAVSCIADQSVRMSHPMGTCMYMDIHYYVPGKGSINVDLIPISKSECDLSVLPTNKDAAVVMSNYINTHYPNATKVVLDPLTPNSDHNHIHSVKHGLNKVNKKHYALSTYNVILTPTLNRIHKNGQQEKKIFAECKVTFRE